MPPYPARRRRESWKAPSSALRSAAYLLTHKGIRSTKRGAIWCLKYFNGPFGSCAIAVREEEEEEDETGNVEGALYMYVHFCWEARLAMCTVQFPLRHGKLRLSVFGPVQE